MAKYNFSREAFRIACLAFDAAKVSELLSDAVAPDANHAECCLDLFKHCGSAVVRHPNQKHMLARNAMAARIRTYLGNFPEQVAAFDAHMLNAQLVEEALHAVLKTISSFGISKRSPDQQAWACIRVATDEINTGALQLEETLKKNTGFIMLKQPSIDAGNGRTVSLDSIVWSLTRGLAQNLNMLGHRQKWFDTANELVIPGPVEVDKGIVDEASWLFLMELVWTDLLVGWDRVRLFDSSVKRGPRTLKFENRPEPVEISLLEFGPPTKWELHDAIAVSRLTQSLFQHSTDLNLFADSSKTIRPLSTGPVALPGAGSFISTEELIAFHFFEEVLFLPIREDKNHGGGLSLKQWLRGYAFLAELCQKDDAAVDVLLLTKDEIISGLCRGGFNADEAGTFVRHVTFGKSARDLMDNPLVRLSDGRFMIFSPGFRSPIFTTIILSRLASFKPDFSEKGRRFEAAVQKQFGNIGVPTKTFKYKIDDTTYDCDVAALWGRTLFVFECKNHGLAFGHLPSLSDFHEEFWHAAEQAARTKGFIEKNPDVVQAQFGADAKCERVVACVLYATPWGIGRIVDDHDLYSFDASALGKFLGDGKVSLISHRTVNGSKLVRRHGLSLWAGAKPCDTDFLHQLEEPIQLKMERASQKIEAIPREIAPLQCVALPNWKTVELTPEQVLNAMGVDDARVIKILKDMSDFHAAVDESEHRQGTK